LPRASLFRPHPRQWRTAKRRDGAARRGADAWQRQRGVRPHRPGFRAQPVQIGSRSDGGDHRRPPPAQIATTNAFLLKAEIEKESAE
jgi:hypothetical protein